MPILSKKKLSADEIAEKAVRGEDVSAYFTNNFNCSQVNPPGESRSYPEPSAATG